MMRQIVLISQNHAGLVANVCELLAARHINIETLDASEAAERALVQLTVDRHDEALQVLRQAGIETISEDAVLIRLPDEPGTLAAVVSRIKQANLDLRSVRIIGRQSGLALIALAGDRKQLENLVGEYLLPE